MTRAHALDTVAQVLALLVRPGSGVQVHDKTRENITDVVIRS